MSFLVVGDLLEDAITRNADKSPGAGADGELTWLRKRLDNERRDPRARGKHALEADRISSGSSGNQQQVRSVAKKAAEPVDKENGATAAAAAVVATPAGSRTNKVWICVLVALSVTARNEPARLPP